MSGYGGSRRHHHEPPPARAVSAWLADRYGAEVASLTEELVSAGDTTPPLATLDLVVGAVVRRWRVLTSRAVLIPVGAAVTATGGIALAVSHTPQDTTTTSPYFDAHPVGVLVLIAELVWLLTELGELSGRRSRRWRDPDIRRVSAVSCSPWARVLVWEP